MNIRERERERSERRITMTRGSKGKQLGRMKGTEYQTERGDIIILK